MKINLSEIDRLISIFTFKVYDSKASFHRIKTNIIINTLNLIPIVILDMFVVKLFLSIY